MTKSKTIKGQNAQKSAQKSVKKLRATKTKSRQLKMVSALTNEAKKRAEKLDKILLKLAPGPYTQILKQIQSGKRKIDEERRLALQLGERILEKANEVRASLPLPRNRSSQR